MIDFLQKMAASDFALKVPGNPNAAEDARMAVLASVPVNERRKLLLSWSVSIPPHDLDAMESLINPTDYHATVREDG